MQPCASQYRKEDEVVCQSKLKLRIRNSVQLQSILNRVQKCNSFVYERAGRGEEKKGQSLNNYLLPFSPF